MVSENELELLEEYLDEALEPVEMERVRVRVSEDPAFAAACDELRAERRSRAAVWTSLEPSDRAVRECTQRVLVSTRRNVFWHQVGQFARFGSAAAACLLMGLFVGWMGRDNRAGGTLSTNPGAAAAMVSQVSDGPRVSSPQDAFPGITINEIRDDIPNGSPIGMLLVRRATNGLSLQRGDLVLSVDGKRVRDVQSLAAELSRRTGSRKLRVLRDGEVGDVMVNVDRK